MSTARSRTRAGPPAGVALDGVVRVLGGKRVLDGVDLHVPRRTSGSGSSAAAAPASPRCSRSSPGWTSPTRGVVRGRRPGRRRRPARALRADAAARLPAPVADGARQRLPRAREPGCAARDARAAGAARSSRASGSRGGAPAPRSPLRRHAPARRLPAHAARRQGRAAARRAVRRTRRDHARRAAGVAGRRAGGRAADRAARDARRRGGATPLRPRRRALAHGRIATVLDVDSHATAHGATSCDPAFVELRERALEAIE